MWKHPSILEVNKIKKKYKRIFKPMQDHVNEWDPIGLISGGEDKFNPLITCTQEAQAQYGASASLQSLLFKTIKS